MKPKATRTQKTITLVAKDLSFGSMNDEWAFFSWARRIEGMVEVVGVGREVHLKMLGNVDHVSIRDLIALFFRYGLDLTQVPEVFSVADHPWLAGKTYYWFSTMFPKQRRRVRTQGVTNRSRAR